MPLAASIQQALATYDQKKGWFRRLFGDHPAIDAIRKLNDADSSDLLNVYQCFIDHPSKPSQASRQVLQAILTELDATPCYQLHGKNFSFPRIIEAAFYYYDLEKGLLAKLRTMLFGDHPTIENLRKLPAKTKANMVEFYQHLINSKQAFASGVVSYGWLIKKIITDEKINRASDIHYGNVGQYFTPLILKEIKGTINSDNGRFTSYEAKQGEGLKNCSELLITHNVFNEDNFVRTMYSNLTELIHNSFQHLSEANLLNQNNLNHIASNIYVNVSYNPRVERRVSSYDSLIQSTINILGQAKLLSQQNIDAAVRSHGADQHDIIRGIFSTLHQANLLNQQNFTAICQDKHRYDAIDVALYSLTKTNLLIQANFDIILQHPHYIDLAFILQNLKKANILNQQNFEAISNLIQHANGSEMMRTFQILENSNLDQQKFDGICRCVNLERIFAILHSFIYQQNAGNHVSNNINQLLAPNHAALLMVEWNRIPRHLFTQEAFDEMARLSEQPNAATLLINYQNRLLGLGGGAQGNNQVINNAQSTHTASIHKTSSISASNLFERYGKQMQAEFDSIIATVKSFIAKLINTNINQAAKRCIDRLTSGNYHFVDPASQVSTQQLIALSHLAIHDENMRKGTLEDAQNQFVEGLYEIQRGYNLEKNKDLGGEDKPICPPGTFNKFIEKLQSIHPDAVLEAITKPGAALKLPRVASEEAAVYLVSLGKDLTFDIIETIQKEGLAHIWDKIKDRVADRMFDEFGSLFKDRNDANFTGFIEAGQDGDAPLKEKDLPVIKLPLVASDEAAHYLLSLGKSLTIEMIEKIQQEGLVSLWDRIKDKVADRMFNEYQSIYIRKDHSAFINYIETGSKAPLTEHDLNKLLAAVKAHQEEQNDAPQQAAEAISDSHANTSAMRQARLKFFTPNEQNVTPEPVNESLNPNTAPATLGQ